MSTSADARLVQSVSDELATLREFVELLKQEQQALEQGDIDRLMPLVEEKTRLAAQLGYFADRRNEILSGAGLPGDRAGMESWLAQLAQPQHAQPSGDIRGDWMQLLTLAGEARAMNEINGKLIGTRLQNNQQALHALLAAGNQAALYGPDGQTKASGGGRLFGAA